MLRQKSLTPVDGFTHAVSSAAPLHTVAASPPSALPASPPPESVVAPSMVLPSGSEESVDGVLPSEASFEETALSMPVSADSESSPAIASGLGFTLVASTAASIGVPGGDDELPPHPAALTTHAALATVVIKSH
jgi:hypothetical protein